MKKQYKIVIANKYPIETVFDHIPENEINRKKLEERKKFLEEIFFENSDSAKFLMKYFGTEDRLQSVKNLSYFNIACFYEEKGDIKNTEKYINKIKDPRLKMDAYNLLMPGLLDQPDALF